MKTISIILLAMIAINAIVLPNAQQTLLALVLSFGALIGLTFRKRFPRSILVLLLSSWFVTLFYAFIGILRGAPSEAAAQTAMIYIFFPLLWLLVIDLAWRTLGTERIVGAFAYLAILASATVALYMFLFLNVGPQAVAFFGSNANVHLEEGYSGVIMHVSGSLIFLGAAFAAEPNAARARLLSIFALCCLALATIASGRTIAILGLAIGGAFFILIAIWQNQGRLFAWLPVFAVTAGVVVLGLDYVLGVDVLQLLSYHIGKIMGGDSERPMQINALVVGIGRTWLLGAGHGIGVDHVRSFEFPWRYESVFVALVYKIGLVGSLIVLFPILAALAMFAIILFSGSVRRFDAFFGAALSAGFVAGFTNPYPEAFSFQWMYLVPAYYFLAVRRGKTATKAFDGKQNLQFARKTE